MVQDRQGSDLFGAKDPSVRTRLSASAAALTPSEYRRQRQGRWTAGTSDEEK
jgi:hypothetical protein